MKRLIWGIISVLVCSWAGCGTKQESEVTLRELTRAENVMFDYPDSALHILQAMPAPSGGEQHGGIQAVPPHPFRLAYPHRLRLLPPYRRCTPQGDVGALYGRGEL